MNGRTLFHFFFLMTKVRIGEAKVREGFYYSGRSFSKMMIKDEWGCDILGCAIADLNKGRKQRIIKKARTYLNREPNTLY